MARSGRQRFEDFLSKFGHCYRSIEMHAVCGKWNGGLMNIWTHFEFSVQPQSVLTHVGELPETNEIMAVHAVFPSGDARTLMDSVEAGFAALEDGRIAYLRQSAPKAYGVPLSIYHYLERVKASGESEPPPWSYARLTGNGIQLSDCLSGDLGDVRHALRGLDTPYEDFADLLRDFVYYENQYSPVPGSSGVVFRAPLMLRFRECADGEPVTEVLVEGPPAFAQLPARIAVIERILDAPKQRTTLHLPKEGWQTRGDLMSVPMAIPVALGVDVVVALSVQDCHADEFRLRGGDSEESESLETAPERTPEALHRVFIVHGRDEDALRVVEQFIRSLTLDPVILYKQPNRGRTVIEKFEKHSDVGFAVVLLTPDDLASNKQTPEEREERSRQNVILELGYFLAKLGRERVCALKKGEVETPSDIHGVLYVRMDESGAWRKRLARELSAAGLDVSPDEVV